MSAPGSARRLLGRRRECAALDQLVASVRAGPSRALVLRGEAGVGKSALLEYLVQHASGCGIAQAAGVESEMELAYAGLQQLCAPFLDRLERLPGPQRAALGTAFGLRDGGAPDRFLVGLAVLSLLSDIAEQRPRVCVVDDAQRLDAASAQALAFVARRLGAESVGLVFAVRAPGRERHLEGLPELAVGGLDDADAQELLRTVIAGPLDERVRDRIVAETGGNPLALLELRRGRTPAELAGGFGLSGGPVPGRIEQSFRERLAPLQASTRLLLLIASAEPTGDPVLVWRAAAGLGIGPDAAAPAAAAGLIDFGAPVRFGHPLVRSAVYGAGAAEERRRVHCALAEGATAERLYREAIERLSRIQTRATLARAHVLYGEWLRRKNRRADAREQLRVAHAMLAGMGMEAFAERARRELLATGETVRKRIVDTLDQLTPQEVQVARLASGGQTNPEIGAQLFLSPRTVEWHLGKVFGKLGVNSRKELRAALVDIGAAVVRP